MQSPTVSVYIATHNRRALLERALSSVLEQDYGALEVLVSDDGSRDDTPEFLAGAARRDSRVRVIRADVARGAAAARNAAILASSGDFVTGLDDDDRFMPGRVSSLVAYWQLLEETEGRTPSCVYTQDIRVFSSDDRVVSQKLGHVTVDNLFDSNCIGNQVFAPRSHFVDIGMFDTALPLWQDLECFIRMTKRYGAARLLDMPLYEFDETPRPNRITASSENKLRDSYRYVAERHAADSPRNRQRLMLQMYAACYRTRPRPRDFFDYLKEGMQVRGLARLIKARFA